MDSSYILEFYSSSYTDYTSSSEFVSESSTSSLSSDSLTDFQKNVLENQNQQISYLYTICFLLIVAIGIYLAFLFGKFIHNLIN